MRGLTTGRLCARGSSNLCCWDCRDQFTSVEIRDAGAPIMRVTKMRWMAQDGRQARGGKVHHSKGVHPQMKTSESAADPMPRLYQTPSHSLGKRNNYRRWGGLSVPLISRDYVTLLFLIFYLATGKTCSGALHLFGCGAASLQLFVQFRQFK